MIVSAKRSDSKLIFASEASLSKTGNMNNILRNASNYHVCVFFAVPTFLLEFVPSCCIPFNVHQLSFVGHSCLPF